MSNPIPLTINQVVSIDDIYSGFAYRKYNLLNHSAVSILGCFDAPMFSESIRPDLVILRYYLTELYLKERVTREGRYKVSLDEENCDIYKDIDRFMTRESLRSMAYLLVICLRESRHCKNNSAFLLQAIDGTALEYNWTCTRVESCKEVLDFLFTTGFMGLSSEGKLKDILRAFPADITVGGILDFAAVTFARGSFPGSKYGGQAWLTIADCAYKIFSGEITFALGMDLAFTLSHNCGSIYGKPLLYLYSYQTEGLFTFLLDIQRSGQLVQAIFDGHLSHLLKYENSCKLKAGICDTDTSELDAILSNKSLSPLSYLLEYFSALRKDPSSEYAQPFSLQKVIDNGAEGMYEKYLKPKETQTLPPLETSKVAGFNLLQPATLLNRHLFATVCTN